MKRIGIISTSALFLVVSLTAPAYAQKDDNKDGRGPAKEQQAKPEQQHAQPAKQARPAEQQHTQQAKQAKPAEQQHTQQAKQAKPAEQQHTQQAKQAKPAEQQHTEQAKQAKPAEQQHTQQAKQSRPAQGQRPERSEAQQRTQRSMPALRLSARGSGRIPDARFQANFGRQHEFRIGSPRIVDGYSRFQYGGFWFGFDQPWPVGWYYTDDVYVDYINGEYFLCNPYYPGVYVGINVVL